MEFGSVEASAGLAHGVKDDESFACMIPHGVFPVVRNVDRMYKFVVFRS